MKQRRPSEKGRSRKAMPGKPVSYPGFHDEAPRVREAAALESTSAERAIETIRKGLPFEELLSLRDLLEIPLEQLAKKLGISHATLHRRKHAGRLERYESDRVMRYARLAGKAVEVFGDIEDARKWLKAPQYGLNDAKPLDFAETEIGSREVENLLGRIQYGVYS